MNGKDRKRQEDFIRNVMSRTSGSPCEKACGQLPELSAGTLEELDRRLVQAHLEHCQGCRSVAVVMGWMDPLLPNMAEVDPGPAFTTAVLGRTTGAEHPLARAARRGETVGPAGLLDRLARRWQQWLMRPRFALEVAYVATVVLVLLTSVPGAPLRQPVRQAGEMIQAGPTSLPLVGPALVRSEQWIEQQGEETRQEVSGGLEGLKQRWQDRRDRTREPAQAMAGHLEQAWDELGQGEWNRTGYQLMEAGRDLDRAWDSWWHENNNGEDVPEASGGTTKEQT